MPMAEFGTFTMTDINRLRILQDVIDGKLRPGQAARLINVTPVHLSRLLRRYRQSGPLGMSNQQRGKPDNRRFAKAPRHDFDVHRPLETDEKLDEIFTWREPRKVSSKLTIQHDKMLYLIEDSEYSRRAIGKYIDTWLYPDGHVELKLNGVALPYHIYDRLSQIDQGDITDNKRLGQVLHVAKQVQEKRDNRRSRALPSVDGPDFSRNRMKSQKKSQRSLNEDDMLDAMIKLQASSESISGKKV